MTARYRLNRAGNLLTMQRNSEWVQTQSTHALTILLWILNEKRHKTRYLEPCRNFENVIKKYYATYYLILFDPFWIISSRPNTYINTKHTGFVANTKIQSIISKIVLLLCTARDLSTMTFFIDQKFSDINRSLFCGYHFEISKYYSFNYSYIMTLI